MSEKLLKLQDYMPYRLSVLSRAISQSLAKQYSARFNIGINEWRVMAILAIEQPLSANEVARHTSLDKVQISRAINKMLEMGLLQRETDSDDKRRHFLSLSQSGQAIYEQIVPLARSHESELLSVLTAYEQQLLVSLIDKLHSKADQF